MWNLSWRPGWPQTQRFTCLSFLSAWIKGVISFYHLVFCVFQFCFHCCDKIHHQKQLGEQTGHLAHESQSQMLSEGARAGTEVQGLAGLSSCFSCMAHTHLPRKSTIYSGLDLLASISNEENAHKAIPQMRLNLPGD